MGPDTGEKPGVIEIESDAETPAKRPCRKLASPAEVHLSAEEQACDRGVIYDGDMFICDLLIEFGRKYGDVFSIEVRFQPMSDGFMK